MSDKIKYGGQAVIEGVMMRSPRFFSVACRRQNGEIVVRTEPVPLFFTRYKWARWPFMRGVFALADALVLGMKSLLWSANIAAQDDREAGRASDTPVTSGGRTDTVTGLVLSGTVFVTFVIAITLSLLLPSAIVGVLPSIGSPVAKNLIEGVMRVGMFLGYIQLISRMKHVKVLFGYHGAEHKAINGYEAEGVVDVAVAARQSTIHPRCGTNFVLTVLLVKVLVATAFGWPVWWLRFLIRLGTFPLVAAVAFEVIALAGTYRNVKWLQALVAPGLWTQRLTTREPDRGMIEVAVASLKSVMEREQEAAPKAAASGELTAVGSGAASS